GTALGVAAALATLAAAALLVALLPLVEDEALSAPLILTLAVAAGLPPTAVFGTRLLDLQASLESNEAGGYLALVGAAAWLIGLAAGGRGGRPTARTQAAGGSGVGGLLVAGVAVAGGAPPG